VWLFAAVLLPATAAMFNRMRTLDLAYHVRAGVESLSQAGIVRTDHMTFVIDGEPWLNQQWLAQIVLGSVHELGGWEGLVVLRGALAGLAFLFLLLACRARGASPRVAAGLTLLAAAVTFSSQQLRPQLIALPLFTATLWIVATRREHPGRLWILPLMAVVWTNVHGSFVLASLPVWAGAAEDLIEGGWVRGRRSVFVAALVVATSLVNPYGPAVWGYVLTITSDDTIREHIVEWQSPFRLVYSGIAFLIAVGAVAAFVVINRSRLSFGRIWPWLALLGLYAAMGMVAVRATYWFSLTAVMVVSGLIPPRDRTGPSGSRRANLVVLAVLGLALIGSLPWWRTWRTGSDLVLLHGAPKAAVARAQRVLPSGAHLFVSQPLSSWVEFQAPGLPVFVDARIELFPDPVWDQYFSTHRGDDGWRELLDLYQVDGVLLEPEAPLVEEISRDEGWTRIHEDSETLVFVRSG
jgi:hypothetical protein